MRDVMRLYAARESGLHEAVLGSWDEAPARLVEGLAVFDRAYRSAEADIRRAEAERREREARLGAARGRGRTAGATPVVVLRGSRGGHRG